MRAATIGDDVVTVAVTACIIIVLLEGVGRADKRGRCCCRVSAASRAPAKEGDGVGGVAPQRRIILFLGEKPVFTSGADMIKL